MISKRSLILGAGAAIVTQRAVAAFVAPSLLRNPLAWPGAYTKAGINPNFNFGGTNINGSAVGGIQNIVLTAVATPGQIWFTRFNRAFGSDSINGTQTGTATASIDNLLGPVWLSGSSGGAQRFTWSAATWVASVGADCTYAAIFRPTSTATSVILSSGLNSGGDQAGMIVNAGTMDLNWANNNNNFSNLTITANQPYFCIISSPGNGSTGGTMNALLMNMATGAFKTQTVSGTTGNALQFQSAMMAGNWVLTPTLSFPGGIAAVAILARYLTIPQLKNWAATPWDFWYPPNQSSLLTSALTSSFPSSARLRTLRGVGQ